MPSGTHSSHHTHHTTHSSHTKQQTNPNHSQEFAKPLLIGSHHTYNQKLECHNLWKLYKECQTSSTPDECYNHLDKYLKCVKK